MPIHIPKTPKKLSQAEAYLAYKAEKKVSQLKHFGGKKNLNILSMKLKKGLKLKPDELISDKMPDELDKAKKAILPHIPRTATSSRTVSREAEAEALARVMLGDTYKKVEEKMNLSHGYIGMMMSRRFPDRKVADELLEDVLLSAAHLATAKFIEKADDLSAKDAAVSAGIFTQRYIEKKGEREGRENPVTPINVILQLNDTLKKIEGKTIDVTNPHSQPKRLKGVSE